MKYDIFLSYATEEKEQIVRPLATDLRRLRYKVWFDEIVMTVGDSIKKEIDGGIINSNYGVIIISQSYLKKRWTNYELSWFVAKENLGGNNYIIPIWHDIKPGEVEAFTASLNNGMEDNVAPLPTVVVDVLKGLVHKSDVNTDSGLPTMVAKIIEIAKKPKARNTKRKAINKEEELAIIRDADTIDLYNEWHLPKFKKSIQYVTEWITANRENNTPMIPLSKVEDTGGDLEYHVFEIIHFYEKWALLSKAKVIDKQQIFKLLGSYSKYFEENLIAPLLQAPETNSDFNNLLDLIKTELLNKP